MSNRLSLSPRDRSLLKLLSWTPATTSLLLRASATFDGEPFAHERRLRERLQALMAARFVRAWPAAQGGGGLQNYYKLTPTGFAVLYGPDAERPAQSFFGEVSPTFFAHTFRLAEAIVETVRACYARRVAIERFFRENELCLEVGDQQVRPDCFFRLVTGGRAFNLAFEVDNSTESLDSNASNAVRQKLAVYDRYQEHLLFSWLSHGRVGERPRFRVVFLTQSVPRAYHILSLAAETATNRSRRLIYAATHESFVTEADPLFAQFFVDHLGNWQSLIDLHPSAPARKEPVRIGPALKPTPAVW